MRDIPDDLHRAARIAAIEAGISLRELVIQALQREVERRQAEGELPDQPAE